MKLIVVALALIALATCQEELLVNRGPKFAPVDDGREAGGVEIDIDDDIQRALDKIVSSDSKASSAYKSAVEAKPSTAELSAARVQGAPAVAEGASLKARRWPFYRRRLYCWFTYFPYWRFCCRLVWWWWW